MQNSNNKVTQPTATTDDCLSAKELVNRHLQNKDHEISDEELQKIALDCDEPRAEANQAIVTPDATSTALNTSIEDSTNNSEDDKEEKDVLVTPLDVLG